MADIFRIYSVLELKDIHRLTMLNRKKIKKTHHRCGCFYCLNQYDSSAIIEWTDNKRTALCPFCQIDSVLYENTKYPLTSSLLEQMEKFWFGY